jgi:hypothetical protein
MARQPVKRQLIHNKFEQATEAAAAATVIFSTVTKDRHHHYWAGGSSSRKKEGAARGVSRRAEERIASPCLVTGREQGREAGMAGDRNWTAKRRGSR